MKGDQSFCKEDCNRLCKTFLHKNDTAEENDKYNDCVSNCKNVLLSCKNFCDDDKNADSIYCNTCDEKPNPNFKSSHCPKVYKKKGHYMVYVSKNSYYGDLLNYSGEKSYGKNLEKARYTYNVNFPKCPIPDELLPGEGVNYLNTCPFIINDVNPCFTNVCAGVNWDVKDYHKLKLNNNCKKAVSNYCQINYNIDDKCVCWSPEFKDDPKCIEYRRFFENPKDYCSPAYYNIEEHPDFKKYIKKDNIPCWGCNIQD
jgi:hypothetical protein